MKATSETGGAVVPLLCRGDELPGPEDDAQALEHPAGCSGQLSSGAGLVPCCCGLPAVEPAAAGRGGRVRLLRLLQWPLGGSMRGALAAAQVQLRLLHSYKYHIFSTSQILLQILGPAGDPPPEPAAGQTPRNHTADRPRRWSSTARPLG